MLPKSAWERFFDAHAPIYDENEFTKNTAREVDFLLDELGLPSGASILDVGCGTGRHSVELAKRGYAVTGLDLSRTLLAKASELAQWAGVQVDWVEEDMRRIPETWAARFDGIINVFTAWGYFETEAQNEKVIEAIARSLKLDGRFLLDVINREWLVRHFRERTWRDGEAGIQVLESTRLDLRTSRSETETTLMLPDGRRIVRQLSVRLFTLAEVSAIFGRYHLAIRDVYGGWSGEEYGMDSRRMIVVAERQK
jgi:SAM-dependent methyltransferase